MEIEIKECKSCTFLFFHKNERKWTKAYILGMICGFKIEECHVCSFFFLYVLLICFFFLKKKLSTPISFYFCTFLFTSFFPSILFAANRTVDWKMELMTDDHETQVTFLKRKKDNHKYPTVNPSKHLHLHLCIMEDSNDFAKCY